MSQLVQSMFARGLMVLSVCVATIGTAVAQENPSKESELQTPITPTRFISIADPAKRKRPSTELPEEITAKLDVVYADYGQRQMHLDLFQPKELAKPLPVLVVIHGGGWQKGDKSKFRAMAQQLALKGWITAAIEYRLSGEAQFPAALHDCKAAIRWLKANAKQYHIDPNRIGLVGGSAGGHLAALVAATGKEKSLEGNGGNAEQSSAVQAAVILGGPTDLTWEPIVERTRRNPQQSFSVKFLGSTYDKNPAVYRLASPVTHVDKNTPPLLFFDGQRDRPGERYVSMVKRLDELKRPWEFSVIQHGHHGCWNVEPWFTPIIEEMDRFFRANLLK